MFETATLWTRNLDTRSMQCPDFDTIFTLNIFKSRDNPFLFLPALLLNHVVRRLTVLGCYMSLHCDSFVALKMFLVPVPDSMKEK